MAVFWVVAPCSQVEVYDGLMMEAASTSEESANSYQTTTQKTAICILAAVRT
jgi:hypothetical protein